MKSKQKITILGSTGSIGSSTLEVIALNRDSYQVFALVANSNVDKLLSQCLLFEPSYVVIMDSSKAVYLKDKLLLNNSRTQVLSSLEGIIATVIDNEVDIVMSAIVGSCGLLPTYRAIVANKKVLLANKESLVAAGSIMINALKNSKARLIPVDSEHNAIFQALDDKEHPDFNQINRIILTASGGPFLHKTADELKQVSVEEALKHPNWVMGRKITIDSSTLMNKGLEVIEAYWLFGQDLAKIDVVIHPQSIIHSMVEYIDGSIIAQLGVPDMKTPIAYALSYPKRINSGSNKLNFTQLSNLTFFTPDYAKFPCLKLAFTALKSGYSYPAILNAANELAVEAFLNKQITFYDINRIIEEALNHFNAPQCNSVDEVIELDKQVRSLVKNQLLSCHSGVGGNP
jgi:1-deoxy-D-xylulose-5-phosphate reductoisomerase